MIWTSSIGPKTPLMKDDEQPGKEDVAHKEGDTQIRHAPRQVRARTTIFWVQRRGSPRKIGAKIIHHQTPGAGGPPVTKEGGPPDPRASTAVPTQATQRGIRSRRWIPS